MSAGTQVINGVDTCKCTGSTPLLYDYNARVATVAASMSILYYSNSFMQAYMGVDLGVSMISEHDINADKTTDDFTQHKFAGQFTLVGCRFGHALGAFAELGLGYKGLVCMGLSYQAGWGRAHRRY